MVQLVWLAYAGTQLGVGNMGRNFDGVVIAPSLF